MELKDLQAGDKVFYSNQLNNGSILTVTRTTKTMIVCDKRRFNRQTGYTKDGGQFDFAKIQILTDELSEQVYHRRLVSKIEGADLSVLRYSALKQIYKIITKHTDAGDVSCQTWIDRR